MTVQLNHTIIPAKDKKESARFLSEVLGLPEPFPFGPFMAVQVDSLTLDYDIFVNVPRLDAKDTPNVQKLWKASDVDFRLKPDSAAVDRGTVLPNVTEGFAGRAPDLGALEVGAPIPHYGPRAR